MSHFHSHPHTATTETEGVPIHWAGYYDLVVNLLTFGRARRLRQLTIDLSLLKAGESLLDVGCGTGSVAIAARQHVGPSAKVAGIDPAPEMIAVAQRKAQRKNLKIDFRVGVIEALPFPDTSFDVVTASLMIHHLPSNELQAKAFAEVYRVLKPGGRFLIADMIASKASAGLGGLPTLFLHRGTQIDVARWLKALEQAGFTKVAQLEQNFSAIGFVRAAK